MFARTSRGADWTPKGNEVDKFKLRKIDEEANKE